MQVTFSSMQSLGNRFIVAQNDAIPKLTPELVRTLAHRASDIDFDQLLLVSPDPSDLADIYCRIFNADGSQAQQCGNGMRCIARFAYDQNLLATPATTLRIRTDDWITGVEFLAGELLRTDMGEAELDAKAIPFACEGDLMDYPIEVDGLQLRIAVVSFGNPHAVVQVDNVDDYAVQEVGDALQAHACFPESVNVEYMQCLAPDRIKLRIYERGVGETQACGSGATAASWVAMRRKLVEERIQVVMPGGELLAECCKSRMLLTGPADYIEQEAVLEL